MRLVTRNSIIRHFIFEMERSREDEEDEAVSIACLKFYISTYVDRKPCRTSVLSGASWVHELLTGHEVRCFQNLRMHSSVFSRVVSILETAGLEPSRYIGIEERVSIFLYIVGQAASNRAAQERFQRSGESISRFK